MKTLVPVLFLLVALSCMEPPAYCGPLHDAVCALDLSRVASLLRSEPGSVNARDTFDRTPLHCAVVCGSPRGSSIGLTNDQQRLRSRQRWELVELLLANGADINASSTNGTPMHLAAIEGDNDVIQLLISHGADVNIFDAAMLGLVERVERLVRTDPALRNATDPNGMTALHWAAARGRRDVVKRLLIAGADPDLGSESGETPLQAAAYIGSHDVVELLLSQGARVDAREYQAGLTALHRAAQSGDPETISLLLAKGADVNAKEAQRGLEATALHLAAAAGHKQAVELLLSAGADVNARDSRGQTPLWYALSSVWASSLAADSRTKIADLLRKHGGRE